MTIATLMATCVVFVAIGLDGRRLPGRGALRRRDRLHRRGQRRRHVAGPEDRLPRRRHAAQPADRPHHRRARLDARDRRHDLPARSRTYRDAGRAHGIGGAASSPAPQATLMATIIKGLLAQNLPWAPVLVGVFLAFMAQLAGAHALSWAVGAYLPISTTVPDLHRRHDEGARGPASAKARRRRARSPPGCSTRPGSSRAARSAASSSRWSLAFIGDVIHQVENPTLLEKLDLGAKLYPGVQDGARAATSSAPSSSRCSACCWSGTRRRRWKRSGRFAPA